MMDNLSLAVVVLGVVVFLLLKRASFVSAAKACGYLKEGALVVDVRSPMEHAAGHPQGAINIPLDRLREGVEQEVKSRDQVILVHCLSGGRSAVAKMQLRRLGYRNVYNLGSLGRAKQIVDRFRGSAG